jgi:hypothetical protein
MRKNRIAGDNRHVQLVEVNNTQLYALLKMQISLKLEYINEAKTDKGIKYNKVVILIDNRFPNTDGTLNYTVKTTKNYFASELIDNFYINDDSAQTRKLYDSKIEGSNVVILLSMLNNYRTSAVKSINGNVKNISYTIPGERILISKNAENELIKLAGEIDVQSKLFGATSYINYINKRYHIVFGYTGKFLEEAFYYMLGSSRGVLFYFGANGVKFLNSTDDGIKTFKDVFKDNLKLN